MISAPIRSALSGQPVVVITQPLCDADGKLAGIVLGAIDLLRPSFSAQLDALRAGAGGYLFIVAGNGVTEHHPDKARILDKADDDPGTLLDATLRTLLGAAMLTACAGLFGWAITYQLLRPLARLHAHVEDTSAGRADIAVFDVARRDEFGHLSRVFYSLSQRRKQAEQELHHLATTDVLTGLNNRRLFDALLPQALARAARAGHTAGDQVRVEFARRLSATVRSTDTVTRLAGDEFIIVFEQLTSAAEMHLLGQRILAAML